MPRLYTCQACQWTAPRQFVRCQDCGRWYSMRPVAPAPAVAVDVGDDPPLLSEIADTINYRPTGLPVLDRALGGGLVAGQALLVAGPPGAGKTTLCLAAAARIPESFYVSAEETLEKIAARGRALGLEGTATTLRFSTENDPLKIEELADRYASRLLVVDSLNVLADPGVPSAPGTPSQEKACAGILIRWAKRAHVPVMLLGHVTWDDRFQGPRTIEHLVDTVVYYELGDDASSRVLSVTKNRFGPVQQLAVPWTALSGEEEFFR